MYRVELLYTVHRAKMKKVNVVGEKAQTVNDATQWNSTKVFMIYSFLKDFQRMVWSKLYDNNVQFI